LHTNEDLFEFEKHSRKAARTCGSTDPDLLLRQQKKSCGIMFFLPAGIKKQGVVEKAAVKQAAGGVSPPIGAWGGSGQKSRQGGEVKKRDEHCFSF
jgi:hypothetical protein